MKIAIYGSRRQQSCKDKIRSLINRLVAGGAEIYMHRKLYDHLNIELGLPLSGVFRVNDCPSDADLAISLGGDGTFLRTVAWLGEYETAILGINTGHLGFLTAESLDQAVDEGTDRILTLNYRREKLSMLHITAAGNDYLALNEVVLTKDDSASMITADVTLDNTLLGRYTADGVLVSTPTGSTAYNLSVGGPIIEPTAPVWVISPIAAHSLTLRPIVVSDTMAVDVVVGGRASRFRLVTDGRSVSLPMDTTVKIRKSAHKVCVLQPIDRNFADIISQKLSFNS